MEPRAANRDKAIDVHTCEQTPIFVLSKRRMCHTVFLAGFQNRQLKHTYGPLRNSQESVHLIMVPLLLPFRLEDLIEFIILATATMIVNNGDFMAAKTHWILHNVDTNTVVYPANAVAIGIS